MRVLMRPVCFLRRTKMSNTKKQMPKSKPVWTVSWCYRNDRTKTFKVSGDMKSTAELFDLIKVIENVECSIERTSPK